MSKHWTNEIWAYATTRWSRPSILLLITGLGASVMVVRNLMAPSSSASIQTHWANGVAMCGFALQLRLWDDLADVDFDRRQHPHRVLPQSAHRDRFWQLLLLLVALNFTAALPFRPWPAITSLLLLHVILAAWYLWPSRHRRIVANYHVVLLKYPMLLLSLAMPLTDAPLPARGTAMAVALSLAIYTTLCIYEVIHDPHLRAAKWSRAAAIADSMGLVIILGFLGTR